jgi:hypothetical protein
MEKLELKYVAPYLPYGLKGRVDKENQIRLLSDYLKSEKHGFRRLFIEMEIKAIERDLKLYKTMHSGHTVYFGTMILESALNY